MAGSQVQDLPHGVGPSRPRSGDCGARPGSREPGRQLRAETLEGPALPGPLEATGGFTPAPLSAMASVWLRSISPVNRGTHINICIYVYEFVLMYTYQYMYMYNQLLVAK